MIMVFCFGPDMVIFYCRWFGPDCLNLLGLGSYWDMRTVLDFCKCSSGSVMFLCL